MKRYLWLLALPWVVKLSTCVVGQGEPGDNLWLNGYDREVLTCNHSQHGKESAEDLAAALNEAHERRTSPINNSSTQLPDLYWKQANPEKQIQRQDPFPGYKAACGQDDCGEEK